VSTPAAVTATTAERPRLAGASGSLSWAVRALLAFAAVLAVAAIFAVWANRQLLDTGYWTRTNTRLLANRPIQDQLSEYLTEQLYANVDLAGELRSGLPKQLKPLAAPAAGGLRSVLEKAIGEALRTPQVQRLWRNASDVTHAQLVALIENRNKLVHTPGGGAVVLDLRPIVANLAKRFGTPAPVVEKLRSSVGEITILRSRRLKTLQGAVRGLHDLAIVLPALVLALFALAIGMSRGRRSRALVAVGEVAIASALATLIVRSITGMQVVNTLASTEAVRPAASAAWSIATSVLVDISVATIFVGAAAVLGGLLGGRSQWAFATRRRLAPYLRDRPDLAFGAAAVALLVVFVWGPIAATQKLLGIATIAVLTLLGVELLRRQTAAEFPSAHYLPERDGLRGRVAGARGAVARRSARLRDGAVGVAQERRARGPQIATVDQLERLAALHASGALTDEEFAAAKRSIFSD
jgi:Short C-terminal domain